MNVTEAPPAVPGECTCKSRKDHCPYCQALEARVKAEGLEKPRRRRAGKVAPPADVPPPTPPAISPAALWVTAANVAAMLGVSVRTVGRLSARPDFPRPVRLSRKLVRFSRAAVLAWAERMMGG